MSLMLASRSVLCRNFASRVQVVGRRSFQEEAAKFFAKHNKRNSPLSPSLAILMKNMQVTSGLSITHRITGLGVGLILYGIGIAELSCSNLSFEQILDYAKALPDWFIQFVKIGTGTAIGFHTFNGVRHLSWDAGFGYKIKDLYRSGYVVIGLTIIVAAYIIVNSN